MKETLHKDAKYKYVLLPMAYHRYLNFSTDG